jgi:hypothetical protein
LWFIIVISLGNIFSINQTITFLETSPPVSPSPQMWRGVHPGGVHPEGVHPEGIHPEGDQGGEVKLKDFLLDRVTTKNNPPSHVRDRGLLDFKNIYSGLS